MKSLARRLHRGRRRHRSSTGSSSYRSSRAIRRRKNRRTPSGPSESTYESRSERSQRPSHQVRLPGFLKQPLPRGTDAPVGIKDDPNPRKKKKRCRGCSADALTANNAVREGDKEPSNARFLERTLFAMRGFGQWHIEWGAGCYGLAFAEFVRSIGSGHIEDLEFRNAKCKITNRLAVGLSNLKFGSKQFGQEGGKSLFLGDFAPVPNSVLEDHVPTSTKTEANPSPPRSIEMFRLCVGNQTNVWCLLFGQEYRSGREDCLYSLLDLQDETPELFTLNFLLATWEALTYDYLYRMFDGMRKLGQFCRPSDDIVEIRRSALNRHPDGGIIWQPPLAFDMISSSGYCRPNIIPRLESGAGRQTYATAQERIVGRVKKQGNHSAVAGVEADAPYANLYPSGERDWRSQK